MNLIPDSIKQKLKYKLVTEGSYDDGGDYIEGGEKEVIFEGAILPLSERDMQYLPEGTYNIEDMKLYTDEDLQSNTIIETVKGVQYQIYGARKYDIISDFKRYFMKRVDNING